MGDAALHGVAAGGRRDAARSGGARRPLARMMTRGARWTLTLPAAVILVPFLAIVIVRGLQLAFHGENLLKPGSASTWVGLGNFARAVTDPILMSSVRVTLTYVIAGVAGELVLGISIALLMHRAFRGKGVVRALILVPMVLTPVVAGLTWRLLLDPSFGTINYFLGQLGLGSNHGFLSNPSTALATVIVVEIWQNTPYVIIIALAGLEALDRAPFEAAALDGAHGLRLVWHITLPMLSPVIAIIFLLRMIDAVKTFALIQTMTKGGPGTETLAISNYVYRVGFEIFDIGYSTALAIITSLCLVIVVFPLARRLLGLGGKWGTR